MAEKVLHEIRIVETDDGFRIEINGDKDKIREFLTHRGFGMGVPGMGMPPGPMGFGRRGFMHRRHHEHGRHPKHGPFGHFARFMSGPWDWDDDEEADAPRKRGPEADKGADTPRV